MKYELVKKDYKMRLNDIGGVAVDSKDNVYASIRGPSTPLVVFDKNGDFVKDIGTGMGIINPHGICVDPEDNIWMVDGARHVVHKFLNDGTHVMTLGNLDKPSRDSGAINMDFNTVKRAGSPFHNPAKVSANRQGEIYVADGYANCCVHHFSAKGELINSWGAPGGGPGEFRIVHGVGIDLDSGDVYIADRENFRVQIFDSRGKLLDIWNELHRPTDVYIRGDYVYISELGELLFTEFCCYDPRYRRHHSQVRVFDKKGNELYQIGTEDGGKPGSFLGAHGICADGIGDIYVCEVNSWDRHGEYAAWPNGVGRPTSIHPAFQKFKKIR